MQKLFDPFRQNNIGWCQTRKLHGKERPGPVKAFKATVTVKLQEDVWSWCSSSISVNWLWLLIFFLHISMILTHVKVKFDVYIFLITGIYYLITGKCWDLSATSKTNTFRLKTKSTLRATFVGIASRMDIVFNLDTYESKSF